MANAAPLVLGCGTNWVAFYQAREPPKLHLKFIKFLLDFPSAPHKFGLLIKVAPMSLRDLLWARLVDFVRRQERDFQ